MSFQWDQFLDLAEELVKQQQAAPAPAAPGKPEASTANASGPPEQPVVVVSQEAALRTSISRAYYAAYHIAREYVEGTGRGVPTKEDSHDWVWKQFDPRKRRQEGAIKEGGFTLKRARKAADYDLGFPSWDRKPGVTARNWMELAQFSALTARRIQKLVAGIPPQR